MSGLAADLVQHDPAYRQIIDNLLGRIVVAENLDRAVPMAQAYGHRFRIVTLDGQVLNAGGSMTGGSVSRSAGILSRANELARLKERQVQLESRQNTLQKQLAEAQTAASRVSFELADGAETASARRRTRFSGWRASCGSTRRCAPRRTRASPPGSGSCSC